MHKIKNKKAKELIQKKTSLKKKAKEQVTKQNKIANILNDFSKCLDKLNF